VALGGTGIIVLAVEILRRAGPELFTFAARLFFPLILAVSACGSLDHSKGSGSCGPAKYYPVVLLSDATYADAVDQLVAGTLVAMGYAREGKTYRASDGKCSVKLIWAARVHLDVIPYFTPDSSSNADEFVDRFEKELKARLQNSGIGEAVGVSEVMWLQD